MASSWSRISGEQALQVWDAQDGRKLRRLDVGIENIHDFRFSPDGKVIAAVGFQFEPEKQLVIHRLSFVDFATGRQLAKSEWNEREDVWRLSFSPDGKIVATSSDGGFRLWNVATGERLLEVAARTPESAIDRLLARPRKSPPGL